MHLLLKWKKIPASGYLYSFAEMLSSIASDITSDEMITISWGLALT
jgi:hypothetical protein